MRRRSAWHYLRSGRGQMTRTPRCTIGRRGWARPERRSTPACASSRRDTSAERGCVLGPSCEMRLAQVLAMTGDRDGAFDKLGKLVKLPFGLNHGDLKLNPMWDDLRDDPRFDRILAESALPLATKR